MLNRTIAIVLATTLLASIAQAAPVMYLDAAEYDVDGNKFDNYAAIRPRIDNRLGTEDLTNVSFRVEIHSGSQTGWGGWHWDTPGNPWLGAPDMLQGKQILDNVSYRAGYSQSGEIWQPLFRCERLVGHPDYVAPWPMPGGGFINENLFDISGTIPAGLLWDFYAKIIGDVELFSTAEGELASDQITEILYDTDPLPQTAIPEPATMVVFGIGAMGLLARRKK